MDDVLQALDDYGALHGEWDPMQWNTKAEQKEKIAALREIYFQGKPGHDSLVREKLSTEMATKLEIWIGQSRSSIKIGIEKGFIKQKSDIYKILRISPCPSLAGTTIHIRALWYSLLEEPMNIVFPSWDEDDLTKDPSYSILAETNQVAMNGMLLALKGKPRKVFELLALNRPSYVSKDEILSSVWNDKPSSKPHVVKWAISQIRAILQDESIIEARYGLGYRLRCRHQSSDGNLS
jgi:hypothetical protein